MDVVGVQDIRVVLYRRGKDFGRVVRSPRAARNANDAAVCLGLSWTPSLLPLVTRRFTPTGRDLRLTPERWIGRTVSVGMYVCIRPYLNLNYKNIKMLIISIRFQANDRPNFDQVQ